MVLRQIILTAVISSLFTVLFFFTLLNLGFLNNFGGEVSLMADREELLERMVYEDDLLVDMIERVNPAVVSIVVTKDVPIYERYYEEFSPWGFFGGFSVPRTRELGTEEREVGGGSGFVVSADGLVVTNRHVVSDENARYSILMNDGTAYVVEVLARDTVLDIAILQINHLPQDEELVFLTFGSSENLRLGQKVVAIGNAFAEFRNSVSVGVVSGLSRSITATDSLGRRENLEQVIQTDAAINPGNSGGPLLNIKGEVVGVNVATSRGADNIGFALPAYAVKGVVESVQEHGKIVRPFLGVRYVMITPALKERNNLQTEYGALVTLGESEEDLAVMPGSPADVAGIVENDIILSIDGQELREVNLATVLRNKKVGDTVLVKLIHEGEEIERMVTLNAVPE